MSEPDKPVPRHAYAAAASDRFVATELTRGPWHPDHQHAGPPIALICRAIERAAAADGLSHVSRLTANLLRPVPIGELVLTVATDYAGRNAGHYSAQLSADGKVVARATALVQREHPVALPDGLPGHPPAMAPQTPAASPVGRFPFAGRQLGYSDLVETRIAQGRMFRGPCAVWFRLNHALVDGETPSPYQRVAVAADSGNGISAVLDLADFVFVNSDLTFNLLRRPRGDWVCLDARTLFGPDGCGLAESTLFDADGLIGRATQSLSVRRRAT